MKCPDVLATETQRIKALSDYGLDDEHLIASLDPVVHIASRMFDMPVAAVNMIGSDHVFFAASVGVGEVDMRRDVSFCAHAINQTEVMLVPDARLDERFHDNPLVTGEANLRFYAGVPLLSPDGLALGALCVIDDKPHADFSQEDCQRLKELAKMVSDRLELRRIEVSSNRGRPNFSDYVSDVSTPIIWFDENFRIVEWNHLAAEALGYLVEEKNNFSIDTLLTESARDSLHQIIDQALKIKSIEHVDIPLEISCLRKNGSQVHFGLSLFCWNEHGHMKFELVLKDQETLLAEQEEIKQQANLDVLTGLLNRGTFYRCVEEMIGKPLPAAVLILDIDDFKALNDTLGFTIGDAILREIAVRLKSLLSTEDYLARLGGDEFGVLFYNVADVQVAMHLADSLLEAVASPMTIGNQTIRLTASCGLAVAPHHAQEALALVSNADLALSKAKTLGCGCLFSFTPVLRAEATKRRLYGLELHRAVDEGEFLLLYQPQINLISGELTGAEALLRWNHPKRGLLTPATFLSALEMGPLASTVGSWVLNEACAQAAYWRRHGASHFRIGVNLSAAQFRVGDLISEVMETLDRHGLPPKALELEITENIVLNGDDIILKTLKGLYQQGVGIAFDDFGTGYASLSLLKTYPLTRIKIDQSFVRGIQTSAGDTSVIRAILDMAKAFNLETIAEGIEAEVEHNYLKDQLCDEGQGYLFGKPMPINQFERAFWIGNFARATA